MSEVKCGKCGTPVGWHSRPGGMPVAVCATCDGEATSPKPSETEGVRDHALALARLEEWWLEFSAIGAKVKAHDPCIAPGWDPACAFHVVKKSTYDAIQAEHRADLKTAIEREYKLQQDLAKCKAQLQLTNSNWPHEKKLHEKLLDCRGDLACALTDLSDQKVQQLETSNLLSDARREVEEWKEKYIGARLSGAIEGHEEESARSAALLSALDKIWDTPCDIDTDAYLMATIAEEAIEKHNSGKDG